MLTFPRVADADPVVAWSQHNAFDALLRVPYQSETSKLTAGPGGALYWSRTLGVIAIDRKVPNQNQWEASLRVATPGQTLVDTFAVADGGFVAHLFQESGPAAARFDDTGQLVWRNTLPFFGVVAQLGDGDFIMIGGGTARLNICRIALADGRISDYRTIELAAAATSDYEVKSIRLDAEGRVYVLSAPVGINPSGPGGYRVSAFSVNDTSLLWSYDASVGDSELKNPALAALAGSVVAIASRRPQFSPTTALESRRLDGATGQVLWSATRSNTNHCVEIASISARAAQLFVLARCSPDDTSELERADPETGNAIWSVSLPFYPGQLLQLPDGSPLVGGNFLGSGAQVSRYASTDGSETWHWNDVTSSGVASLAETSDGVFAVPTRIYPESNDLPAVRLDPASGAQLAELAPLPYREAATGFAIEDAERNILSLATSQKYGFPPDGRLSRYDSATGSELWSALDEPVATFLGPVASFIAETTDGHVATAIGRTNSGDYFEDVASELTISNRARATGAPRWTLHRFAASNSNALIKQEPRAIAAASDGDVFAYYLESNYHGFDTTRYLERLAALDGSTLWRTPAPSIDSLSRLDDDLLAFGAVANGNYGMARLSGADGHVLWSLPLTFYEQAFAVTRRLADGSIVVATSLTSISSTQAVSWSVRRVDSANGQVLWKTTYVDPDGFVVNANSIWAAQDDSIFVLGRYSNRLGISGASVHRLDKDTGQVQWSTRIDGGRINHAPFQLRQNGSGALQFFADRAPAFLRGEIVLERVDPLTGARLGRSMVAGWDPRRLFEPDPVIGPLRLVGNPQPGDGLIFQGVSVAGAATGAVSTLRIDEPQVWHTGQLTLTLGPTPTDLTTNKVEFSATVSWNGEATSGAFTARLLGESAALDTWTCAGESGAACAQANGTGPMTQDLSLAPGGSIQLSGTAFIRPVVEGGGLIDLTIDAPFDAVLSDTSTPLSTSLQIGNTILRDGFE